MSNGWTQERLAEVAGVQRAVVNMYESGRKRPSLGTAVILAHSLGVSLDWLCGIDWFSQKVISEASEMGNVPFRQALRTDVAKKNFGTRLRDARERFGLSQDQVATRAGVKRPQLSLMEKGEAFGWLPTLVAIADALEVSVDWLCGRTGDFRPEMSKENVSNNVQMTVKGGDDVTTDPNYLTEGSDSMETHNPPPSDGAPGSTDDWRALAHRLMDYLEQRQDNEASRINKVEAPTAEAFKVAAEAQREQALANRERAIADHEAQLNMKTILSGGLPHIARPADEAGAEASGT